METTELSMLEAYGLTILIAVSASLLLTLASIGAVVLIFHALGKSIYEESEKEEEED